MQTNNWYWLESFLFDKTMLEITAQSAGAVEYIDSAER